MSELKVPLLEAFYDRLARKGTPLLEQDFYYLYGPTFRSHFKFIVNKRNEVRLISDKLAHLFWLSFFQERLELGP